jgi:hypothetical protein
MIRPMGEGVDRTKLRPLAGAAWTIPWTCNGLAYDRPLSRVRPQVPRRAAVGVFVDHRARRAGPREHGRQAARSKRDRPERASE